MAKTFDYNPARGTWYEIEDDSDGNLLITTKQDVQPSIDWARKQKNSGVNDKGGKRDKGDLKHYAHIPAHVELALRQKGINIYDKGNTKALIREIERNYPHCKVTNRKLM